MSGAAELTRAGGETLLWWSVTFGFWSATLTSTSRAELATAALGSLPCAVVARFARRANGDSWHCRLRWLGWAATVARDVPRQSAAVWRYALRPARRHRSTIGPVLLPAEPEPTASARRAVALLALASTPATVVLDSAASTNRVLLHRITSATGRLEAQVRQ